MTISAQPLLQETFATQHQMNADEQQRYTGYCTKLPQLRQTLLAAKTSRELPILALPDELHLLDEIKAVAAHIRANSGGLIVLGTGGSSLGGKTLCAMASPSDDFEVHFIENLDPHSMDRLLQHPKLSQMHLLMISKSGGTMETLSQAMLLLCAMQEKLGKEAIASKAHAITMPCDSALRQLAQSYQIPILTHDPKVGGRFSVLSNVALLPAAVAGVNIEAVLKGASNVMQNLQQHEDGSSLQGAAWQAALMLSQPVSVLMPYADRMRLFGDWYRQLWAESLGKEGIGSTPATALGSVDHHSQLQLYLDGPKDKLFTLVTFDYANTGAAFLKPISGFEYLAGKTIGDSMAALQHGALETFKRHQLPLRQLHAAALNEQSLGALLMHFMLETMATAKLLGINAFDQPAVEESKQLARQALGAA